MIELPCHSHTPQHLQCCDGEHSQGIGSLRQRQRREREKLVAVWGERAAAVAEGGRLTMVFYNDKDLDHKSRVSRLCA